MAFTGDTAMSESRLRTRDAFLNRAAADLMVHDQRLIKLDLKADFDRGVAHLTGDAADPDSLRLARLLIGRLDGVLAVWDRVRVGGQAPVIIDLGCGENLQYPENIGIDKRATDACMIVADLADGLPLGDRSVDRIFAVHVLEHLADYLPLLDECHRVLRPGGLLHVLSPWWRHVNAVADPTHVRFFDVQTIKSICLRPPSGRRWFPLHVACDGASIFADLAVQHDDAAPDTGELARFFD